MTQGFLIIPGNIQFKICAHDDFKLEKKVSADTLQISCGRLRLDFIFDYEILR